MMSWSGYNLLRDATYQWCLVPDVIYCMMLHTNDGLIRIQFYWVMLHINDVLIRIWFTAWCYISMMCWSGRFTVWCYISMMFWSGYDLLWDATYQCCLDPDAIYCMMVLINDVLIRVQFTTWCYISMMSWSGYNLLCDATYQWCLDPDIIVCMMLHIYDVLIRIQFTGWRYILMMSWSGYNLLLDDTFLLLSVTDHLYKSICNVASTYDSYVQWVECITFRQSEVGCGWYQSIGLALCVALG